MGKFDNKICVVTGAASGIGWATAQHFAREGGRVVLVDRANPGDRVSEVAGTFVQADVSDEDSVEALFKQVFELFGRVDILVNNAGIIAEAEIDLVKQSDFRRHIDVNTFGVLLCTRYGARLMPPDSSIVNTASMAGRLGFASYGAYAASKAAVISLTQVSAIEYGPRKIRVNCICPASVETPMLQAQKSGNIEREISKLASPLGIVISPDEVAEVIAFLASSASSALTGQAINVDAGMSAGYSSQLLSSLAESRALSL
ncbi:SDR family oxidoreductase [Ochrobactrum sp. SFR4]|uniref:SDR family NAD(P)-dependent oxidoreductase n=1 Tax=Ochrobactrum sp. SFR4 TaxID=2717368 RepID=UPI001C8C35F1|nr:SDR family oxidoreductase [Ochrobactrum sp. SFR4]MBX8827351.1 SDR family oxidoreductase [Ochrobactrum sp. SFR4]